MILVILESKTTAIFASVKRLIAILFIFLLSAQCIFKLGIITYFQVNRDYIAEVLCVNKETPMTMCYGECFLDRNLSLVEDDSPKQTPATSKLQAETTVFVKQQTDVTLTLSWVEVVKSSVPQSLYTFSAERAFFHPPC